jgi:hypothetical protein
MTAIVDREIDDISLEIYDLKKELDNFESKLSCDDWNKKLDAEYAKKIAAVNKLVWRKHVMIHMRGK